MKESGNRIFAFRLISGQDGQFIGFSLGAPENHFDTNARAFQQAPNIT
jgi:hypothetical protein